MSDFAPRQCRTDAEIHTRLDACTSALEAVQGGDPVQ